MKESEIAIVPVLVESLSLALPHDTQRRVAIVRGDGRRSA